MIKRLKKYISSQVIKIVRNQWKEIYLLDNIMINSRVGKSVKIYPIYRIENSEIGDYTYIAQTSVMIGTKVGKFCSIGPNLICGWGIHPTTCLTTSPMFYSLRKQNGVTLSIENKIKEQKGILIGNDVFIGMNVTILDGITIGSGAIIGAGAVVSKDIPPYAIAVGNPVKVIKYRFGQETISELLKINWWEWPDEKLIEVEKNFFDVSNFVSKYRQVYDKEN